MSLEIRDLSKHYGDVTALKSLSFELQPGKTVALLGPNGAGKSTAIRILVTLLKPDRGGFLWNGEDLLAKPKQIRDLVGYVSQEMAMDKVMTGAEFMRFCAGILHLPWKTHRERAYALLDEMGLKEAQDRQVETYSGGMKRRLDLATALLNNPKILILDEPTTGLDLEARETIWGLLREFKEKGGSLILASHDFREVQELSDEVLILDRGEVISRGTPDQLKDGVGEFILRLKTHEFMNPDQMDAVRGIFESWGPSLTWHSGEAFATLAYRGEQSMAAIQGRIYRDMEAAGLNLISLYLQKPSLEDAYRLSQGRLK